MITGDCLCGAISWQVDGALDAMTHCHCSRCRKIHGAAFATYVNAASDSFHWLSERDAITSYESSPGFVRVFCGICGSVAPDVFSKGRMALPVGCLNEDPVVRPMAHIFASSKAAWHNIDDTLQKLDGYPSPDDGPNLKRVEVSPAEAGVLRGSCQCGEIAYEVTTPLMAVHNCHCSRCRKARAAAYATDAIASIDGVKFVRGAEMLQTFKVPSARYFTQVFCKQCGSPMPQLDHEREIAIIPLGSLDDEPSRCADAHIYTRYTASWFTITDDLPRFEEASR
jgi:hypothetical protein